VLNVPTIPPIIELLPTPPDGRVKAIASTIFSIYWDWKSIEIPEPGIEDAPCPAVGFFLFTSFQSLDTFSNSFNVSLIFYVLERFYPLTPLFPESICIWLIWFTFFLFPREPAFAPSDSVNIHGWVSMSEVFITLAGLPSFFISLTENLYCIHLQIKS
jgi:hypothetical protein